MADLELDAIRNILTYHLGPDFAHSAAGNRDHHVPSRVLERILAPVPSASQLDAYLRHIADGYGVAWSPEHARQDLFVSHVWILSPSHNFLV
jgi:vacuolar protein sorting-associated protein IST1